MALRVLAVAQAAELGGAELAFLRLLPALRGQGLEFELAVPAEGAVAARANEEGVTTHLLPFGPLRAGGWPRAIATFPRARRLVRETRPDVVWLNGIVPQRLVPALGRVPALLYLHDFVTRPPRLWRSGLFWRRVPLVACDSQAVAERAGATGAPEERLRTIPPPVEAVEPAGRPDWADAGPVIGYVGRIEPRKGLLDLLDAVRELLPSVPGLRLVVVRGPAIEPDAEYERAALAAAAELGDAVRLVGPVPDARALMPWFDVLCAPSLAEPFGTVAAEALAAGTPAVVTDSGGMAEYVVPGRSGDVVPPGDPARLAAALAGVLENGPTLAEGARAAAAPFATEAVAREVAELLREAARG